MPTSKYIYREVKSSWGIYIEIVAESRIIPNEPKKAIKVTDRLFFSNAITDVKLTGQELQLLISGLRWVAPQIDKASSAEYGQLIELKSITLILTDFQAEGLYMAIAGWAANHFNFPMPEYQVYFNKELNRYEFSKI